LPAPGQTGAVFVPSHSGGLLDNYGKPTFGPDGNLYIGSYGTNNVLRYDGSTGAFLGAFVPAGSGGLSLPEGLAFGPDGNLYVVSQGTDNILRYDGSSGAFLGVFSGPGGTLSYANYLTYWDQDAPGPAPAPSHPHRTTLEPIIERPRSLDLLFAQPSASQPQAPLPSIPAPAARLTKITQPMSLPMLLGQVSRPEPTAPSFAVFTAGPVHVAIFGGCPDPLLDVLARDVWM
jgi:hypothetical protein